MATATKSVARTEESRFPPDFMFEMNKKELEIGGHNS